jgi:protein-S-isoprenylcysteine O-methyltransferase Ste14
MKLSTQMAKTASRGQGWVIGQFILIGCILISGFFDPWHQVRSLQSSVVGIGLIMLGIYCLVVAFRDLGTNLTAYPKPLDDGQLVTTGIYAIVRHPIYTGLLATCVGVVIISQSSICGVFVVALSLLLDQKANREEGFLATRFVDYPVYRTHTRKFIPFIW